MGPTAHNAPQKRLGSSQSKEYDQHTDTTCTSNKVAHSVKQAEDRPHAGDGGVLAPYLLTTLSLLGAELKLLTE